MSDFDKEAEREKLRKKFEDEEESRQATEQMSELLLKGATMTNAHCSNCGDPIFRYDGQEFCPTCQQPVDRGTDEGADESENEAAPPSAENGDAGDERIEVTTPSTDASVQFGGDDAEETESTPGERRARSGAQSNAGHAAPDQGSDGTENVQQVPSAEPHESATRTQEPATHGQATPRTNQQSTGATSGGSAGDHLGQAQVVLAQTVERFARQAAEADTPREAREQLEAAREAAETLDAAGF